MPLVAVYPTAPSRFLIKAIGLYTVFPALAKVCAPEKVDKIEPAILLFFAKSLRKKLSSKSSFTFKASFFSTHIFFK